MDNNTLYHYGVLGMRWGRRKGVRSSIVADKPKGKQPPWQHQKSEREKQWEDDHGFNPHRPNGTKPGRIGNSNMSNTMRTVKNGIRTIKNQSSKNHSDDHTRAKSLKKKKLSQLSNAELKELNNRMQLESQYKNLKRQNISTGRKFVQDVVYDSSKEITKEYTKKYAKKGIELVGMAIGKK